MKTIKTKTAAYLLAASTCLLLTNAKANNIYIQNVSVSGQIVSFTISWDNSWWTVGAPPNNYDAAWVFVKFQDCTGPSVFPWSHAALNTTSSTHTITCQAGCTTPTLTIDAVSDGMGVFIHRTGMGSGSTGTWNVSLTATTVSGYLNTTNTRVFGIEMAYIPGAVNFSAGDGSGTTTAPFNDNLGIPGNSYTVTSNGAIAANALYAGHPGLNAAYPKGYDAFYCMKSEISQEQYCSFLNTLTYDQQVTRTALSPSYFASALPWALTAPTPNTIPYNRNGIKLNVIGFNNFVPAKYIQDVNGDQAGSGATDGIHIACNYLSWGDVTAFLDWAALRPMTELEYEKVCRGIDPSVADEYPWGGITTTSLTSAFLTNPGAVNEVATTPGNGLCVYDGAASLGPVRGGAAATSSTTRVQAAAAYYGPLDMAGNVWEQVVNVDANGATFTGANGNGALPTNGNADAANWPSPTTAAGSGARGGSWFTTAANAQQLRTSDRTNAGTGTATRNMEYGGRGLR